MKESTQVQAYKLHLKGYQNKEIAKKLKLSESGISKAITELTQTDQYQLGQLSVVTFLEWFEKAAEFWHMQNSEYQEMIEKVEKIKMSKKLDEEKKLQLMFQQTELVRRLKGSQDTNMERIVYLAKEGELIGAIKLMKDMLVAMPKKPKKVKIITADAETKAEEKDATKTVK